MTCNTTELIDKLQRASRNGVSSREDIAYALLTVAAGYLAGGDADTVRRIMSKLERDAPLRGSRPSPWRCSPCRYHQGDLNGEQEHHEARPMSHIRSSCFPRGSTTG